MMALPEYAGAVRALILGSSSAGPLKEMLDRRHSWGADRHDEVWRGVLRLDRLRAHADLAQQLGELLSPPARAAGMTVVMGECNFGEAEHDGHELDGALRLASATSSVHGSRLPKNATGTLRVCLGRSA